MSRSLLGAAARSRPAEEGVTRYVSKIGHLGAGALEVSTSSLDDPGRAKPLVERSYDEV